MWKRIWNSIKVIFVIILILGSSFLCAEAETRRNYIPLTKGKVVRVLEHGRDGIVVAIDSAGRFCEIYVSTHVKVSLALERGETPEIECRWYDSK